MKYSEIARAVVASISARKERLEVAPPISDLAWQYASGMVYGAREVLAAIELAESGDSSAAQLADLGAEIAMDQARGGEHPPEMCKGGGPRGRNCRVCHVEHGPGHTYYRDCRPCPHCAPPEVNKGGGSGWCACTGWVGVGPWNCCECGHMAAIHDGEPGAICRESCNSPRRNRHLERDQEFDRAVADMVAAKAWFALENMLASRRSRRSASEAALCGACGNSPSGRCGAHR